MLASILSILGFGESADPEPFHGPEEIAIARQELTNSEKPTEALIGLARLSEYGGEFSTDLKAVIPLSMAKYQPAPLTFDVDGDALEQFCAAYGVEVHDLGALDGQTLPIRWEQGSPVPDWQALADMEE